MTLEKGRLIWPRTELASVLARLRGKGIIERVVLANGGFELLQAGEVRYLESAASHGQILVVALLTDAALRKLAGPGRPILPLAERAEILGALRCVDAVTSYSEPTLERSLRVLKPDVHAQCGAPKDVPEREVDRELGIEIAICGDGKASGSVALLERLAPASHARKGRTR